MAKLNKGQRQLHHTSSSSIEIGEGFPNVKEGNEGDITLRHIRGKGVYIFVKFRNRWYSRQLLSGQGRSTGVKESQLENPTSGQQLNFYDPNSGQHLPVDVSEVFTLKFGSPGKLTLGSRKAKSSGSAAGNPGRLQLGDDKANIGHLALGDAGTNVNVDNEFGSISVGAIDDGHLGFLKLWAGSTTQVNRRTILKAGGAIDTNPTFKLESENSYYGTSTTSPGALLKLRRIGTGATVETETKMGSLYVQGGDDDCKLYFKNHAGAITTLSLGSTGGYIPLAGSSSIAGHLVPATDGTYNLGSASYKWRDLHLLGDTIFLGNVKLKSTGAGLKIEDAEGTEIDNSRIASVTELITSFNNRNFETTGGTPTLQNWTGTSPTGFDTIEADAGKFKLVKDAGDGTDGIRFLDHPYWESTSTLSVGRNYRLTYKLRLPNVSGDWKVGIGNDSNVMVTDKFNTHNSAISTESAFYIDFTYAATDTRIMIYVAGGVSGTAYFDEFSLRELLVVSDMLPKYGGTMTGDISHAGDFALDVAGSIELNADTMTAGNGVQFKDASAKFASFEVHHSASYLNLYENGGASTDDFLAITCGANGATSIITVDAAAEAADLTIDIDGDITLDSQTGVFIAKKGGTEFSAANSSYAGMILGYRDIGLNEAEASYNMTTSYAVPTDEFGVTFVAPPSGNVEYVIENIWLDYGSSNAGDFFIGLSTANATSGYSRLASYHEKNIGDGEGRGAENISSISWTLTGLTAGTSYTYYVGVKSSSTAGTPHMSWGGDASGESPDIIIKAIALPATIST